MSYEARAITIILFVATIATISSAKRFYITRHGACTDCANHGGTDYKWCHLGTASHDWDYCSTEPGYATRGQECKDECGFHGQSYRWCYLKKGGWDYCSLIEDTTLLQFTTKGDECQNYCDLEGGTFVCRKKDRTSAECSPVDGIAANGPGCKSLSNDGKNSCHYDSYLKYSWCYTNGGSWLNNWGYCSNSKVDDWSILQRGRGKRSVDRSCSSTNTPMTRIHEFRQRRANGATLVTAIYAENPNSQRIRYAEGVYRDDSQTVLYNWLRGIPSDRAIGGTTEQSNGRIRLDRQPRISTSNYGIFMNWQLQINGEARLPTSVAQVAIPETFQGYGAESIRRWRRLLVAGLHYSLNRGATVWIFQQIIDRNGNIQCPRRGN